MGEDLGVIWVNGKRWPPAKPCSAIKNGEPCKKLAVRGSTICRAHGAYNEGVKRKADESVAVAVAALRFAAPEAVAVLVEGMGDDDSRIRLSSAVEVLKKTVKDAATKVEADVSMRMGPTRAYETVMARLDKLRARHEEVEADRIDGELPTPPAPARELTPAESEVRRRLDRLAAHTPRVVDADPDG